MAVSSSAETLIASGGIWKSLDADQETASISGDGISAPSTESWPLSRVESITPIQMLEAYSKGLYRPAETNTETSSDPLSALIREQTAQIMRGLGTVTELLDSVLSLPDLPWDTMRSYSPEYP